jgi:hypothetical protein
MEGGWVIDRLSDLSLIGVVLTMLVSTLCAAFIGYGIRRLRLRLAPVREAGERYQESYLVGGMLGLLALLLAFSFAMGIDRYEDRRRLVIQEANAIGTSYLSAQLLDEPHRSRLSGKLIAYTDNRIAMGLAEPGAMQPLLAIDDRLIRDIWASVTAARESAQARGISASLLAAYSQLIDLNTERKLARMVRIPDPVLLLLFGFSTATAGALGFFLEERFAWFGAGMLFLMLSLYVSIISDLNRPTSGNIRESQGAMLMLRQTFQSQPSAVFDRYKPDGVPGG